MTAVEPGAPRVTVIGPVPPPLTGRTTVTACVVKELARLAVSYTLVDTAVGSAHPLLGPKLHRAMLLALRVLDALRQTRGATVAYISVDGSPGTLFTIAYALVARLLGARIALHHHSHSYIAKPLPTMRCLCRAAGRRALHITPSAAMDGVLKSNYTAVEATLVLSNAFAVDPELATTGVPKRRDKLVLGHLSNLRAAKGTLAVIDCFAELHARGEPVELHIAGPTTDHAVARAIRQAAGRFGAAFRYHGFVGTEGKRAFFSTIHVFLFPSTFVHELQPLVVLESLAAGVPVIAVGRAGIPELLEAGGGVVVPCDRRFKPVAVHQIIIWGQDRAALRAAGDAGRSQFAQLRRRSAAELGRLTDWLKSDGLKEGKHSRRARTLFIGPLPPPVTGRTVTTVAIFRRLSESGVLLKLANINPATDIAASRGSSRVYRAGRAPSVWLNTVIGSRRVDWAYIAVDAGAGMYFTAVCTLLARMCRLKLLLHHHNYSYVGRKTFRMSLLATLAGRHAVHINVCDAMAEEMRRRYPLVQKTLALSNVISVGAPEPTLRRQDGPLVLGHLSNLTLDKGIATVVNCLRLLREQCQDVRLLVAGPAQSPPVRRLLDEAEGEFGAAFEYLGPVYDSDKSAFYRQIDVFLFPSSYENETQGIVNLEAMAYGVPVISYGQCCIPSDLAGGGGVVVSRGHSFEAHAVPHLASWARDRDLLSRASAAARQRFEALRAQGEQQFELLINVIIKRTNCEIPSS